MEKEIKIGEIVEAEVTRITDFGAFVKINGRDTGLIHISQISHKYVKDINEHLKIGDKLKARVIKVGPGNKIDLGLKNLDAETPVPIRQKVKPWEGRFQRDKTGFKSSDFEDKLKKFLKESQHSLADLKKRTEKYY